MNARPDLAALLPYATPRQAQFIDAITRLGSYRKASEETGVGVRKIFETIAGLRRRAAREGHAPGNWDSGVAPGYLMGKVTVQRDAGGAVERTWERQSPDQQLVLEALRAAVTSLAEEIPRRPAVKPPKLTAEALATVYTLTDAHVGALAWRQEAGADWDLRIAERTLTGCFDALVEGAPKASLGIVAQLGDFLHMDNISPATPTSGHLLDADGRFSKVVQIAVSILRRIVDRALQRHRKVIVLMAEGNHDISSSIWLRVLFAALYEKEPRVQVIDSPLPYYAIQFGKTFLGWHHGHLKKNNELPLLFAAQFPKLWGDTTKRYVHTGHRHHVEEREHSGITVIQHPTLAARDAYAARGGWIAERQASAITYHAEYGQVGRNTVVPEMIGIE
jgi:hypothetical protein